MDVLIVHYHLNPGGVTRIIEAQIKALEISGQAEEIKVLCGNANKMATLSGHPVAENPVLDYHVPHNDIEENARKLSAIMALFSGYSRHSTVFHFHNANLGKNPLLTSAVYKLAAAGFAVVNHCHDFAEDRPANLAILENFVPGITGVELGEALYPGFPNYHYVVINSCDYSRLLGYGIPVERMHLLQNPILPPEGERYTISPKRKTAIFKALGLDIHKMLCTYPVRVIRRKNIGEYILLAALFADTASFIVTLPPRNPGEIVFYERWKKFARENNINMVFEAGEKIDFNELLAISDFCITTSTREGFGMVFLEPWLAGTPVIGRSIPCVMQDLQSAGLSFPCLYNSIVIDKHNTDFKDLEEGQQEEFIKAIINDSRQKNSLLVSNPVIASMLNSVPKETIVSNRQIILEKFSIKQYGNELLGLYKEISQ